MMPGNRVPTVMRNLQPQTQGPLPPTSQSHMQSYPQMYPGNPPSELSQEQRSYSPYTQQPQRGATPTSAEPASVAYARQRNSMLSNSAVSHSAVSSTSYGSSSAQIVHAPQYPQPISRSQPVTHQQQLQVQNPTPTSTDEPRVSNDGDEDEGDGSLLAYARNSTVSSDGVPASPASAYPPTLRHNTLPPQNFSNLNIPPLPTSRVHQHEDAGSAFEVPPAYRDQYPGYKPRPPEPK